MLLIAAATRAGRHILRCTPRGGCEAVGSLQRSIREWARRNEGGETIAEVRARVAVSSARSSDDFARSPPRRIAATSRSRERLRTEVAFPFGQITGLREHNHVGRFPHDPFSFRVELSGDFNVSQKVALHGARHRALLRTRRCDPRQRLRGGTVPGSSRPAEEAGVAACLAARVAYSPPFDSRAGRPVHPRSGHTAPGW